MMAEGSNTRVTNMNTPNGILIGWNRVVPGHEGLAAELYQSFVGYLTKQQEMGTIIGFQRSILHAHGGDMNGFFFIQGEPEKLLKLKKDDTFYNLTVEGNTLLLGWGVIDAYVGETCDGVLQHWGEKIVPKLKR
jgi:hypothetical protein